MPGVTGFPAFLLATLILCAMPGPDLMYVLGRTLAQGRRAGVVSVLGVICGAGVHVAAAALGLSAVLAASAEAFALVKYAGAAYLVYMGLRALREEGRFLSGPAPAMRPRRERELFLQGMLTDVLNPKVALFFLAFLPQFIDPAAQDKVGAFLLLGCAVLAIGLVWDLGLVLLADRLVRRLRGNARFERLANRVLGAVLVGLGLALASEER